ncbi:hypothetical protein [Candidatus Enterovibrio escicola]|uniref:Uncharacterized protein n=1 Tax=Candidatus Enterovibrio escicola TaxID=1927127 RepID=A0A2A5T5U4_9GAMM|nr:hypothetical protein [Candidatus Enterovibrio escacola]PCS23470.1 hypothetical protein BTN49_0438 [Candidatus Enterovibrio escacola]
MIKVALSQSKKPSIKMTRFDKHAITADLRLMTRLKLVKLC